MTTTEKIINIVDYVENQNNYRAQKFSFLDNKLSFWLCKYNYYEYPQNKWQNIYHDYIDKQEVTTKIVLNLTIEDMFRFNFTKIKLLHNYTLPVFCMSSSRPSLEQHNFNHRQIYREKTNLIIEEHLFRDPMTQEILDQLMMMLI